MAARSRDTVCAYIPFQNFAQLLEKVSEASSSALKVKRLDKYFKLFRSKFQELHGSLDPSQAHGDSIFCLVRLLMPSKDRERASYGIKSTVFARMFAKILALDPTSADYHRLLNFKKPEAVGSEAGNLSALIQSMVQSRSRANEERTHEPTVAELLQILDQLAKDRQVKDEDVVTQDKQVKILQGFVRLLKPLEAKWLTRIILKYLDLGLSEVSILKLVHPRARDLLDTTGLEEVCLRLNDPSTPVLDTGLCLFNFFKNMLCMRFNANEEPPDEPTTRRRKKPVTLPPAPFSIETKWDGERFQIHYQRDPVSGRDVFKYFSRGGFDFTSSFSETLSPRLRAQLRDDSVQSFILDGEMMAWNYARQCFTQKGLNIDVKRMTTDNPHHCPAFVAYDLVYLNGELLTELPFRRRTELLERVLVPKEAVYYLSERKEGRSMQDVMAALDEAISSCEEGIVIKDFESSYHCGKRLACWLKLKPEYVQSCQVEDLDLLILGGYYSESSRRGGVITSLLLGLIDRQQEELYPLTSVGFGKLKRQEMEELLSELQPNFVQHEVPGVKYKGRARPDLFIDPARSLVVQVKASEILPSKDYALNYALRFPVFVKARRDKAWKETMTVQEFHDLRLACKAGKLAKRSDAAPHLLQGPSSTSAGVLVAKPKHNYFTNVQDGFNFSSSDEEAGEPHSKKLRKTTQDQSPLKGALAKAKNAVDASRLEVNEMGDNVFESRVFCVVSSFSYRAVMEKKLRMHGGEVVRSTTKDTFCIVAENDTSRTVVQKKAEGMYDIAKGSWVEACIRDKAFKPFVPQDLFFAKRATQDVLAVNYDMYGDSWTEKASLPQVKELIRSVVRSHVLPEDPPTSTETQALKRQVNVELFGDEQSMRQYSFFQDCRLAFRGEPELRLKGWVEFYGGSVLPEEREPSVTHVVLTPAALSVGNTRKLNATAFLLNSSWLEDCVLARRCLSEVAYMLEAKDSSNDP